MTAAAATTAATSATRIILTTATSIVHVFLYAGWLFLGCLTKEKKKDRR